MSIRKLFIIALLSSSLVGAQSYAQSSDPVGCGLGDYRPSARPDPAGTPTTIDIGLTLADLIAISDVDQTVDLNVLLTTEWVDPRLKPFSGCRYASSEIWTPQLQLANSGSVASRDAIELLVQDDGRVVNAARFEGSVSNPWNMKEFPFDTNNILLQLVSLRYSAADLQFRVNDLRTGRQPEMSIHNWHIGEPIADVYSRMLPRLGHEASIFAFQIPASRIPDYYIYKFVFPLSMIVMMSWCIFWISPNNLGPQLSLSATSMLTLIAFQFSMNDLLPKIGYLTLMDTYVLASSLLVFLALLEALVTGRMANDGKLEAAERLDRICRWIFPGTYLIALLGTLVFR